MTKCELCKVPARIFCESDQASLCWDCDAKVHRANFLVARHSRTLLCHSCTSLTPWKASGATLANALSVCHRCASAEETNDVEIDSDDDNDNDNDGDVAADEDGENQVVPWASTPPPLPTSSSSSEWSSVSRCRNDDDKCDGGEEVSVSVSEPKTTTASLKRHREGRDLLQLRVSTEVWWGSAVEGVIENRDCGVFGFVRIIRRRLMLGKIMSFSRPCDYCDGWGHGLDYVGDVEAGVTAARGGGVEDEFPAGVVSIERLREGAVNDDDSVEQP
ncbi:hypothetical protein RJT34_31171 [Clitoria ternatea]|uniref:B box-type domain-containing protein n=1 Tax=Clitoria ternatea TaxID=43366 RepID=A0AAN9ETV0_CLITE